MAESLHCSFCGVAKSAQVPLIAGAEGWICEACVKLAYQVVASWGVRRKGQATAPQLRTPMAIKQHLDDYVIGQAEAKQTLAVAVYNHYLRLTHQGADSLGSRAWRWKNPIYLCAARQAQAKP